MKNNTCLLLLGLLVFNLTFGQNEEKHDDLIREASNYYDTKEFFKSGQKYSEAFAVLGNKGTAYDRYNAACSWALANQIDSAYVQLFKIAEDGNFTDLAHTLMDTDLNSLHSDNRWIEVIDIISANKEKAEASFDKPLVAILDTIYLEDQKYRLQIREIEEKYGWESDEVRAQWKIINEKDSINLIKIKEILDQRGWLGPDIIGGQGNSTLFLVVQHADLETQEKYLPLMREAVKMGNARPGDLALLEDRVALRQGKRQIYGSQIGRDQETGEYYVLLLEDPDNVDKRRSNVGLGMLQDYVSNWGMDWDIEEYKAKLPEIEAKQK